MRMSKSLLQDLACSGLTLVRFFEPATKFKTFFSREGFFSELVGLIGLEPMTLRLSSACSNQLSYRPMGWLIVV